METPNNKTPNNKTRKRHLRRRRRNARRYLETTRPSYSFYSGKWYIHNTYIGCFDYSRSWIAFFHAKHIPIIDGKFPETFPRHLFDELGLDKKKFPQLYSV